MNQQAVYRRSEIFDIFLFFVLSAFTAIFSLSGYFKNNPIPEQSTFLHQHFFGIINLLMVVSFLVYVFLFLAFIQRRFRKTGKHINSRLLSFFILIILFRIVTDFSSPYHPYAEIVRSPFHPLDYVLPYDGISLTDRIINFLCETASISFYILPFTYLREFDKFYFSKFFLIILFTLILLGIVANLYSYLTEWNKILFNIKLFFFKGEGGGENVFCQIQSFTPHKNVYGFFLWVASLSLFLLSVYQQRFKLLNLLMMVYFLFFCIIIKARFPMLLTALTILFFLIYMAIVCHKKNKLFSIFCSSILGCIIFSISLILTIGKNLSFCQKILSLFQDFSEITTLLGRRDLWKRALCLINSPFHLLFGYGKQQYMYFFDTSGILMGREVVDLCHNGFIDILLSYGLFGLIPIILLNIALIKKDIQLLINKNWHGVVYIFFYITITFYGFVESRVLLGIDGSSFLIFLILMMPTMIDTAFNQQTDTYQSIELKRLLLKGIH